MLEFKEVLSNEIYTEALTLLFIAIVPLIFASILGGVVSGILQYITGVRDPVFSVISRLFCITLAIFIAFKPCYDKLSRLFQLCVS
jgi:flagellar biosynthesis protein FliQ